MSARGMPASAAAVPYASFGQDPARTLGPFVAAVEAVELGEPAGPVSAATARPRLDVQRHALQQLGQARRECGPAALAASAARSPRARRAPRADSGRAARRLTSTGTPPGHERQQDSADQHVPAGASAAGADTGLGQRDVPEPLHRRERRRARRRRGDGSLHDQPRRARPVAPPEQPRQLRGRVIRRRQRQHRHSQLAHRRQLARGWIVHEQRDDVVVPGEPAHDPPRLAVGPVEVARDENRVVVAGDARRPLQRLVQHPRSRSRAARGAQRLVLRDDRLQDPQQLAAAALRAVRDQARVVEDHGP